MSNDDSSEGYAEASSRIQAALQNDERSLDLSGLRLTKVPPEIWQLTRLANLDLGGNDLTCVPPEIGLLENLTTLEIHDNQLTSLPQEIGQVCKLKKLKLQGNILTQVPAEIGQLENLAILYLYFNLLTSVPPEIGQLANLIDLQLDGNHLTSVPPELGQLAKLARLELDNNRLTRVPAEFAQLTSLTHLNIDINPLNDGMQAAADRGLTEFLAYLRSLARDSEPLYEAKLVLVGEGNVGKSCLLAALCGEEFDDQPTTEGIDVKDFSVTFRSSFDGQPQASALTDLEKAGACGLPLNKEDEAAARVPDGTALTLHGWDFGGQKVYRVTHQFFYSRRTLYLIVWNARDTAEKCDVAGWLERLRLRVGSEARVLIVCTQCDADDRVARIDRHRLRQQYGDLIPEDGFVEVDSKTETGLDTLRSLIARETAGLPQVGEPFSQSWKAARDDVLAVNRSRFKFDTFRDKCRDHELDDTETLALAGLMHDLGYIVWFSDDDTLRESIIRKPQWLSKAIGFVLEDSVTNAAAGVLAHARLDDVWRTGRAKKDQYASDLHPFFLRLMEKFDVSYRIDEDVSLVAELVPPEQPNLPWDRSTIPTEASLTLAIRFDEDPPGLVPWLIVRHHRRRFGIDAPADPKLHWQQGVFLQDPAHGQALLELVDRELFVTVRGSYPSHLLSVLQDSIVSLIEDRWPGLKDRYHLSVPCPSPVDGKDCRGRFELAALRDFKADGDTNIRCQACRIRQPTDPLLTGHASVNLVEEFARIQDNFQQADERREEFAAVASAERDQMQEQLRELLSRQAESFRLVLKSLESESRDAPRLFSLIADDWDKWLTYRLDPRYWGKAPYRLTLWCEMPDHQHPLCEVGETGDKGDAARGEYVFTRPGEFLQQIGPLARFTAQTLKLTLPLVGAAATVGLGTAAPAVALKLMEKMADTTLAGFADTSDPAALLGEQTDELRDPSRPFRRGAGGASLRELHTLLHELDKSKRWGNLRRVFDKSSGDHLWLCHKHRLVLNPALPVLPKPSDAKTS
jgi:internalin A